MSKVRCAFCKEFVDKDGVLRNGVQSFCNESHLVLYRKSQRKSHSAKDPFPEGLKEVVLDQDGFRCRFCGKSDRLLVVHHIV